MLPWGLQGFSCLKSAVYTGTVWKQHGAPEHPLPPMPLNQSKPPLSFLLYSAFAFLYFFSPSMLPPPSPGHWCQTDLLCAGACFCSSFSMCRWTDEQNRTDEHVQASAAAFYFIFPCFPYTESMHLLTCLLSVSKISSHASFIDFPFLTFYFEEWRVCRNIINKPFCYCKRSNTWKNFWDRHFLSRQDLDFRTIQIIGISK